MEQRKTVDSKTEVKSMENKKIKVALLGLGTVGGGVYKLIQRRSEKYDTHSWRRAGSGKDPGTQSA